MGVHEAQPENPSALADIFSRAVGAAFGSSAVLTEVHPLAGDASSRRYFRLALTASSGAPATVIAMVLGADRLPLSSAELTVFATPPAELPFINVGRFLARIGVRVPTVFHHDADAGVLLLEDVGDTTLRAATTAVSDADVLRFYRLAIDQLVRLQVVGTREADPACVAFQQRFDRRLFAWEFDHFLEYGIPGVSTTAHGPLRDAFAPAADRLGDAPAFLAHRDFHAWNLHVHDGAICVLDFQDALLAPATYDLSSLLTDRDTATVITSALEAALIDYYVEALRRAGAPPDDPRAVRDQYFLCVLQRALKVVGRFHYLAEVKGKRGYLAFLPHVASQARRALAALPADFDGLRGALAAHL
jgi:aminoglycoside/choline kinase family phosphotransferase